MAKHFLLIVLILPLSIGFSDSIFYDFCNNLSEIRLDLNDSQTGIEYHNLTEFPKEIIDSLNEKLLNNSDLKKLLGSLGSTVFSAEIHYNNTPCFSGSIGFNDSNFSFIRLLPDELKGQSDENIFFKAELINIEKAINELRMLESEENPDFGKVISAILNAAKAFISAILSNDFSVQPFSGIFKVIDLIKVLPELQIAQDFSQMAENATQQMR